MSAPVSTVCVTYESAGIIERALESVVDDPLVGSVIVVDNASSDGTPEIVEKRFGERVRVIRNPRNTGFGSAANRGLAEVDTPFALLLNPDAVSNPAALAALVEVAMAHPKAAILGPSINDSQGNVSHKAVTARVFERERGAAPPPIDPNEDSMAVAFIPACYWLMRMVDFERIGGFDEDIFLFYEDDDYCLRATTAGCETRHVPKAMIVHDTGTGSEDSSEVRTLREFHLFRSRMLLEHKHRGTIAGLLLRLRSALRFAFKLAVDLVLGRRARAKRAWARVQGSLLDQPLSRS